VKAVLLFGEGCTVCLCLLASKFCFRCRGVIPLALPGDCEDGQGADRDEYETQSWPFAHPSRLGSDIREGDGASGGEGRNQDVSHGLTLSPISGGE
jgi:hypothetical protein